LLERQVLVPNQIIKNIRAADAKEVGVGNPAEETRCRPNDATSLFCDVLSTKLIKAGTGSLSGLFLNFAPIHLLSLPPPIFG
jgi:hypothetical protein